MWEERARAREQGDGREKERVMKSEREAKNKKKTATRITLRTPFGKAPTSTSAVLSLFVHEVCFQPSMRPRACLPSLAAWRERTESATRTRERDSSMRSSSDAWPSHREEKKSKSICAAPPSSLFSFQLTSSLLTSRTHNQLHHRRRNEGSEKATASKESKRFWFSSPPSVESFFSFPTFLSLPFSSRTRLVRRQGAPLLQR